MTLLLGVLVNLPSPDDADPAFTTIAMVDGEWQPGPMRLKRLLADHLSSSPTLGDTLTWLVELLVIRAYEAIATSKLPDFTFRFRWESGRLRFYDHPFSWVGPGNIRGWTLAQLTRASDSLTWIPMASR